MSTGSTVSPVVDERKKNEVSAANADKPEARGRSDAFLVRISPAIRLVLLSFLMLFVELALIRWIGSNVIYMSYFSNFVLLGSFLGIGIGFLRAEAQTNLFPWSPVALAFLIAFVRIFPVQVERSTTEIIYFGAEGAQGLPIWIALPVIFTAVAFTLATLAEGVARTFVTFKPLAAYRLDVAGSIAGIVAFTGLSLIGAPPIGWAAVAAATFLLLRTAAEAKLQLVAVLGLLAMLLVESLAPFDSWSPYYKVTTLPQGGNSWNVFVNGIPHQEINSTKVRKAQEPLYLAPYENRDAPPGEVLVVGAGNGTDVALALERGATRVDAVEIDPRLFELGEKLHPDRPYRDERVTGHVEDARAFLERTTRTYDTILFALPDSLTVVAGQGSLRLESYLFTQEAIREAAEHLKPGGVFSMYNFYRERWLVDRLALTLARGFGHPPCVQHEGEVNHVAVLTIGLEPGTVECADDWKIAAGTPEPAKDDHPFVYLRGRTIPGFYGLVIGLILLLSVAGIRFVAGPLRMMKPYLDLFFMGAAFLLLETKNVVQFALLFGSTWLVNAIVFTGILVTVLVAIEFADRVRVRRTWIFYVILMASLVVSWLVTPAMLLGLAIPLRLITATAIAFTPVFLANVIFSQRFKDVSASGIAFGANLLGAMVGGMAEYTSLLVGYKNLLLLVAAFYLAAFVSRGGHIGGRDRSLAASTAG